MTIELCTTGDLKIIEKPSIENIGPLSTANLRATIKMSSTEEGAIFGNLSYEQQHGAPAKVLSLNEIKIDIMEHIHPERCSEAEFRDMWSLFEWENKVQVYPTDSRELV